MDQIIQKNKVAGHKIVKTYSASTDYYRLQDNFYGGNGVFFNKDPKRESRYAIPDRRKGAFYVTAMPITACAEMYKGENFIDLEDYNKNCMAIVTAVRELSIIDLTALAPLLHVSLGELMGDNYRNTQALAAVLSKHVDGLEYLSRMTGQCCTVFWCEDISGEGLVATKSVTRLSDFQHDGVSARNMLRDQLDIRITG
ncbi:RES domain-containing protein [Sodalis sp. dw_96]|uniref:RES domain-containing protein n=1 Tax=Sodalis sp. dw_96 TaxID=2719794 RepID=UPI001BD4E238|nr:RES domain-containing protein [Sodalis sp. dw_96]